MNKGDNLITNVLTGQVNVARSIFVFPPVGMRSFDGPPSWGEGFPHWVHGPWEVFVPWGLPWEGLIVRGVGFVAPDVGLLFAIGSQLCPLFCWKFLKSFKKYKQVMLENYFYVTQND